MKIIDTEISLFGQELRFRFVPKKFRSDLSKVGTLLYNCKIKEAENLLDQVRKDYCHNADDIDMIFLRDQINDLKRELMI